MGGAPKMPAPPPLPAAPIAETDPGVEAAKQKELTRLAARKTSQDTIMTGMTTGGFLDESDPSLMKTKLGGA
jgi:hypothetical protein